MLRGTSQFLRVKVTKLFQYFIRKEKIFPFCSISYSGCIYCIRMLYHVYTIPDALFCRCLYGPIKKK
jgi:hypothetical protein